MEVFLQLRGPGNGVAKVPSNLKEVDKTGDGRRGLEARSRRGRAMREAQSRRQESRDGGQARRVPSRAVNALIKQSMSLWRSGLVSIMQAWSAIDGSSVVLRTTIMSDC